MNWVDVTIVIALVVSAVMGLFWGLIRQVAATFGLVLGIWAAGQYYTTVAGWLHTPDGGGLIADGNLANLVAFGGIVVGISLAIGLGASFLRTVLGLIFLGWLDHLLGAVLGVLQMLLLIEVVLLVATFFPVAGLSETVQASGIAQSMLPPLSFVVGWLPPEFQILRFMLGV